MEKPTGDRLEMLAHASKHATPEFPFEASMGIYVFKCAWGAPASCRQCIHPLVRPAWPCVWSCVLQKQFFHAVCARYPIKVPIKVSTASRV